MIKDFLKFIIDKDVHLIIIYILLGWIVYQIIKGIIIRNTKRLKKKRQKTMQKLIQNIVKYVVIVLVGATILNILGVNVTSIVAGLGVVSVILSLALKDVMQDILAGLSIIFEDQFDIGDLVVINYSKTNPNVIIDIPIPYEIDNKKTDKVIDKIIKRTEKEVETLKGNIENWGLNEFKDSCISYRIFIPVKQDTQFSTKRKINRIIKEEFDKENISVPYNIIEVKNG